MSILGLTEVVYNKTTEKWEVIDYKPTPSTEPRRTKKTRDPYNDPEYVRYLVSRGQLPRTS